MQQTRAAIVGGAGHSQLTVKQPLPQQARKIMPPRRDRDGPRNPFCLWSHVLADFFAHRRLVCSSETTYVPRQSDAEGDTVARQCRA